MTWPSPSTIAAMGGVTRSRLHWSTPRSAPLPSGRCAVVSVAQVGLFAHDASEQRLELEPANRLGADLGMSRSAGLRGDRDDAAGCLGEELRLARPFHCDEPPDRRLDGL